MSHQTLLTKFQLFLSESGLRSDMGNYFVFPIITQYNYSQKLLENDNL